MNIIALQASPRKGGNDDVIVDEIIKGAEENGNTVKKYYLEDCDIAPCKACMHCASNPECVRGDDGNKIIADLIEAEGVIFSSPIYYGQMAAQGKLIIDRFFKVGKFNDESLGGKAALVFTENQAEGTYKDYIALTKASPFEFVGYDVIGVLDVGNGAGEPGVVKEQTDKMEEAYEIGKKF